MENQTSVAKPSRKKNLVIAIVATLGIAWVGASYYTGVKIEEQQLVQLTELNKNFSSVLDYLTKEQKQLLESSDEFAILETIKNLEFILDGQYQRGVFSSQANYIIRDKLSPNNYVKFHANISHGPFPLAHFGVVPKYATVDLSMVESPFVKPLYELTQGKSPLSIYSSYSYGNSAEVTLILAPFETLEFNLSGVKITGNAYDDNFSSTFNVDILAIKDQYNTVTMQGLKGDMVGNLKTFEPLGYSFEQQDISIDKVQISDVSTNKTIAELTKIVTKQSLQPEDKNNFQQNSNVRIDAINIYDRNWGSVELNTGLSHLNLAVLQKLSQQLQLIQDNDEDNKEFINTLAMLLKSEPILTINPISWKNSQGESKIDVKMVLKDPGFQELFNASDDYYDVDDMLIPVFIQAIKDLTINAELSEAMLIEVMTNMAELEGADRQQANSQAVMQLSMMQEMAKNSNIITQKDGKLLSNLQFTNNELVLNGQNIPLAALGLN